MLGEQGATQRRALEAAVTRAADLAIAERVHLVLIAGDLFDSPRPSSATLEFVVKELRRLDDAGIRVAIVAGNHDVAIDGLVGRAETLREVTPRLLLFDRTVRVHTLPELDLTLIGRSADPGTAQSPLADWPRQRRTQFAVGVTHGSVYRATQVEGPGTIHPQEIRDLGLDYLALGDWHSAHEILGPPAASWYAGSPELLAYDQEGAGHVLLVEIPAPGQAQVTPVRIGRRRYLRLDVDAAKAADDALRKAIAEVADPDLVCDVMISGLVPLDRLVDSQAIERELADRFFRLRVQNRTELWLDDEQLGRFSEETVLGRFVQVMRSRLAAADEASRPIVAEALQVGVALLQGKEVLP